MRDAAVVGKVFWTGSLGREDGARCLRSSTRSSGRASSAASGDPPSRARASSRSPMRSCATSPTGRSHVPTAQRSIAASRSGSESLGQAGGPRRDARAPLAGPPSSSLGGGPGRRGLRGATRDSRSATPATGVHDLNAYATAERYYADALALWPELDPEKPDLLFRRARALHLARRRPARAGAGRGARRAARSGRVRAGGRGGGVPCARSVVPRRAETRSSPTMTQAVALVADRGASSAKARVLAFSARSSNARGRER